MLPADPHDPGRTPDGPRRPRDAATLIVVRRQAGTWRMLTGRRSDRHVFMPGLTVFPGGQVERGDYRLKTDDTLAPDVEARLLARLAGRRTASRARAIAAAALRETAEEAGILLGRNGGASPPPRGTAWAQFKQNGIAPALSPLRLITRAVTPPGRVRRFDARFFAVPEDAVAARIAPADEELGALAWLTADEARNARMAGITRRIVDLLDERLARDPHLDADEPVPFYYSRRNQMVRDWI